MCLCDVYALNYGVDDILNAHDIYWRFYIVIKITNWDHTDSTPLSVFQQLVPEKFLQEAI